MSDPSPEREPPTYRVWPFLRPYRPRIAAVFLIMVANTFLGLLNPLFLQQLIDRILTPGRADLLWIFAAVILSVALFRFLIGLAQSYIYTGVTARILFDMRRDFLEHLQRLSLRFFSRTRFGDIVTRFNRDLTALQEIATGALLGFITALLTLACTIGWCLYFNWRLFLIAALPFPIALGVAHLFRRPVERLTHRLREATAALSSFVVETLTGIRTVRSYGREKGEIARFLSRAHAIIRTLLSFQVTSHFATGLPRLFLVTSSVIVYSAGGYQVIQGTMRLGELVAMGMYMGMVFNPLQQIVGLYLQLVAGRVSLERVRQMRELPPEIREDPDAPSPELVDGAIAFEEVRFRYLPDQPLLEEVAFEVAAGETVALLGPSGSGKSTIVDLIFRFLDPDEGRVRIDGHDLRAVRMGGIRGRIAVVSQETFLFHDTLLENIRYSFPRAGRDQVTEAARMAGLAATLETLPEGLDTLVGERGSRLSGGERQRVSIARALLRRPRILILDEATSSLDIESDRAIRSAIEELMAGSTTLIITHRLAGVRAVDRVLVLERGRIEQSGPPGVLAEVEGPFQRMLGAEEGRG